MADLLLDYVRETALALRKELICLITECAALSASEQAEFLEQPVARMMTECLENLAATGCLGPPNQLPSQVLWEIAGDLLQQGKLQLRAREKPRGYAGDDLLLQSILAAELAATPLGQAFDQFFLQQDAPRAVVARTVHAAKQCGDVLAKDNTESMCRIAVIGAGPALEIEQALYEWTSPHQKVRLTLLDLDEQALLAARERLSQVAPEVEIVAIRENLFRLGKQPKRATQLIDSDLIICLGLLDYLKAEDAISLLQVCYQSLRDGGRMLFGNFAPQCQARTYMEWIGNWYLTYRTELEFISLAKTAGIDDKNSRIISLVDGACLLLDVRRE